LTERRKTRVRIGISSCLLGENVRFDGGHKKDEFLTSHFGRYRRDLFPLIMPLTLIRHYVRKFAVEYLNDQVYLDPHPDELNLLNQL
jgi:uncharacterized protein YbgA (DUF1722 family)